MSNTFFQLLSHHGIASDVSDSEEEQWQPPQVEQPVVQTDESGDFLKEIFARLNPVIYSTLCYVRQKPRNIKILAVLDTGSSSTIIDKGFAQHHNLPVVKGPYLKTVNYVDRQVTYETSVVELRILNQLGNYFQTIHAEILVEVVFL